MKTAADALVVRSARGEFLHLEDGRQLIDAVSSWWVITHGHCEPKIVQAIQEQAAQLDQVLFAQFSHQKAEQLARAVNVILPSTLSHVFFSDNGSTSVEVAIKMVLQAWRQRGEKRRTKFMTFTHSYHGDTVGAMSVGGQSLFTRPYQELLFSAVHARQGLRSTDTVDAYCEHALELIAKDSGELAAILIEPLIQGAGGMIVWPKEALNQICAAAQRKGIYVIFDEVMTGFGRSGSLFAFEQLDVVPDVLCLSKGLTGGSLPLALTIANGNIFDQFLSETKEKMFFHGHSFTGNPLSCAAALANLELINERDMKSEWSRINRIHARHLELLDHPHILDRRLCGTMAAVEIKTDEMGYRSTFAEKVTRYALNEGVFLRPLGNVIYVLPPYCSSDESLTKTWQVIKKAVENIPL